MRVSAAAAEDHVTELRVERIGVRVRVTRLSLPASARISWPLVAIAVVSALISVVVRAPFLAWPLTVDEAGYAYGARWWFDGLTMYSDDLWFDRPQGIFLAYQAGMSFLGGSTEAIRIIGTVWSIVTAVAVAMVAARMFNMRVAAIAGPLFAVVSVAPRIDGYTANAEVFMIAGATASAYCLWRRWWLAAGLLLGVAVLLKPSAGVGLILGASWLFHERAARRDWVVFFGGAALPMALALAHGILTVGLHDYMYATVLFRLGTGGESAPLVQLVGGLSRVSSVILPLLLVVLAGNRALRAHPVEYRFLSIWVGTAALGIAMGGNWWEHYFLQAIPPLIVMVAVVIDAGAELVRRWAWFSAWSPRAWFRAAAVALPVAGASGLAFVGLILPWASMDPDDGTYFLYETNGYQGNEELAQLLSDRTEPSDQVYIGVSHVSLLYLTDRLSSSPYLYVQQSTEIPGAMTEIARDLEAGVPAYVLVLPRQLEIYDPGDQIRSALTERYVYETSFRSAEVWRRR